MNPQFGTYLVTGETHSEGRSTVDVVRAALEGGVDAVQLREKAATARERVSLGRTLRPMTRAADVPLVVNDRVDVARAVDADGVHLGDDDLPVAVGRDLLDESAVVGRSVSTVEGALAAEEAGADYLGVGALFPTDSKDVRDEQANLGLERVRAIADATALPVVGIGGVTVDDAADVVAAGADGVAVVSAITAAADPRRATERLGEAVAEGRAAR